MSVKFDADAFVKQYGLSKGNDKSETAIHFKSQDSEYRVYIPGKDSNKSTAVTDASGQLKVTLVQDHDITASGDDHSTTFLVYSAAGKLVDMSHDISIDEGKAFQVPQWVPDLLDLGVEVLGAIGALETAGISEVAAQEVVADINAICDAFNKVTNAIVKIADDGGRVNFPAVVCHDMARASVAIHA